jgi:pyruvate dehydrogenase E1 component alpha subunit
MLVDGNDPAAVYAAVRRAVESAAGGGGPTLIEALTYRMEAHTNADDAARYRPEAEVRKWLARDPVTRIRRYLLDQGLVDAAALSALDAEAEEQAGDLRRRMNTDTLPDPADLFRFVYAEPTPVLRREQQELAAELDELRDQAGEER